MKTNIYLVDNKPFTDLKEAVKFGMQNNIKAIHDLNNDKTTLLPEPQKHGTYYQISSYMDMQINQFCDNYIKQL